MPKTFSIWFRVDWINCQGKKVRGKKQGPKELYINAYLYGTVDLLALIAASYVHIRHEKKTHPIPPWYSYE